MNRFFTVLQVQISAFFRLAARHAPEEERLQPRSGKHCNTEA
jgi:hypothetical protein